MVTGVTLDTDCPDRAEIIGVEIALHIIRAKEIYREAGLQTSPQR
jgi:hypothetical protein